MLGKDEQAAIEYLEEPYDGWDLLRQTQTTMANMGWFRGRGPAERTAKFFNVRQDLRDACLTNPEKCHYHAGETAHGNIMTEAYGQGVYWDYHYETHMPCYGIDLDDDARGDRNP